MCSATDFRCSVWTLCAWRSQVLPSTYGLHHTRTHTVAPANPGEVTVPWGHRATQACVSKMSPRLRRIRTVQRGLTWTAEQVRSCGFAVRFAKSHTPSPTYETRVKRFRVPSLPPVNSQHDGGLPNCRSVVSSISPHRLRVRLFQQPDCSFNRGGTQVHVTLRRGQVLVSSQFLNGPSGCATHSQVGAERVTQAVSTTDADVCPTPCTTNMISDDILFQRRAVPMLRARMDLGVYVFPRTVTAGCSG
jgi:hypothetical protein